MLIVIPLKSLNVSYPFSRALPTFLDYSEKSMQRQSFEEARAHALNSLAVSPDNKTALNILKKIEAIERGEKPEVPGLWTRFKNWLKKFF